MRALIKKYPINARYEYENEIWEETRWTPLMSGDDLMPYTNENYAYALCEDCPDDVELTIEDFEVTEHVNEVEDEFGEKVQVKSWTAKYIGGVSDGA